MNFDKNFDKNFSKNFDKEKYYSIYSSLMSTENIDVKIISGLKTARFDLQNRVIELPFYETIENDSEHMLVVHEIGHALFSGDVMSPEKTIDKALISKYGFPLMNVLEDVWVEKNVKKMYPGVKEIFKRGYKTFHSRDFFGIKEKNVDQMNLLDRINLKFKIGDCLEIAFSAEEKSFVDRISEMESREDFFRIMDDIRDFLASQNKKNDETETQQKEDFGLEDCDDEEQSDGYSDSPSENKTEMESDGTDSEPEQNAPKSKSQDSASSEDESETYNNFEKNLEKSLDDDADEVKPDDSSSSPKKSFNVDKVHETVNFDTSEYYNFISKGRDLITQIKAADLDDMSYNDYAEKEFIATIKESAQSINNIFSLKKNANQMSNSKLVSTGSLDSRRLFAYRTSDYIFKRKTLTPRGVNHALVFGIDVSGSMNRSLAGIFIEFCAAMEFCHMQNIPFEAYVFGMVPQNSQNPFENEEIRKLCDSDTYNLTVLSKIFIFFNPELKIKNNKNDSVYVKSRLMKRILDIYGVTPTYLMDCVSYEAAKKFKSMGYEKVINFLFTDGQPCHRNCSDVSKSSMRIKYSYTNCNGDKVQARGVSFKDFNKCLTKLIVNGQSFNYKFEFKETMRSFGPLSSREIDHDIGIHCAFLDVMKKQLGVESVMFIEESGGIGEHSSVSRYHMKYLMPNKNMHEIKNLLEDAKDDLFFSKENGIIANSSRDNASITVFFENKSKDSKRHLRPFVWRQLPSNIHMKSPAEIFYYLKFEFKKINKLIGNAIGELMA
jgi:hypothetical protein